MEVLLSAYFKSTSLVHLFDIVAATARETSNMTR